MIFAISNQKGGVGKSTTAINLSYELSKLGKKVLLIDLDPQANSTSGLGISTDNNFLNSYQLLTDSSPLELTSIFKFEDNLHIIVANIDLAGAEVELVSTISRESVLKKRLKELAAEFDFILIDCPPSLGLITINSLVAADGVIIPVQAEYFALEGLGLLVETIELVKSDLNPKLEVGGVLITMYDSRTNLSRDVYAEINKFFEKKLFSTIIPRNVKLSEAPSHGLPIAKYAAYSSGALAFRDLAQEFVRRFDSPTLIKPNLNK